MERTITLGVNFSQTSHGESQDLQQAENGKRDISGRHHNLLEEGDVFHLEGGIGA